MSTLKVTHIHAHPFIEQMLQNTTKTGTVHIGFSDCESVSLRGLCGFRRFSVKYPIWSRRIMSRIPFETGPETN